MKPCKTVSGILILLAVSIGLLLASGCGGPIQRSLTMAPLDKRVRTFPRKITIDRIDVVDVRPKCEFEELTPDFKYVLFLGIWYQHLREGTIRPEGELYSMDPTGEMRQLLQTSFQKAKLTKAGKDSAKLNLKVELHHLYGITHASEFLMVAYGGGQGSNTKTTSTMGRRTFAPYGYASARIVLSDQNGKTIGSRYVIGQFDPNLADLLGVSANPIAAGMMTDSLTGAAVTAAGNLAGNIVRAVEVMVSNYPQTRPLDTRACSTFYIKRTTDNGLFSEVAAINIDSGEIVSDTIQRRWMEPYSAPNEWVVDIYHGGQQRLTDEQYRKLVNRLLKKGYDVRFVTDLNNAHFFGKKGANKTRGGSGFVSSN